MFDVALHVGTEHPNLLWVFVPSLLAFIVGFVAGMRADSIKEWFADRRQPASESERW